MFQTYVSLTTPYMPHMFIAGSIALIIGIGGMIWARRP